MISVRMGCYEAVTNGYLLRRTPHHAYELTHVADISIQKRLWEDEVTHPIGEQGAVFISESSSQAEQLKQFSC